MTAISQSSPAVYSLLENPVPPASSSHHPTILRLFSRRTPRFYAVKIASDGGRIGSLEFCDHGMLKKPEVTKHDDDDENNEESEKELVDWEDQILADTVPLVGFVRMILHSGKYKGGDRLSPEHEKTILERLLPHHPAYERKVGCGIDYIKVGYHPQFRHSRCLFIVRKDGESVDFSYWKCIKGLIRKQYPLYADTFILRHFRRQKSNI